jgi:hypothetical protein
MVKRELEESGLAVVLTVGDVPKIGGASAAVVGIALPAETAGTAVLLFGIGQVGCGDETTMFRRVVC